MAIKIGQLYLEINNKSQADLKEKLEEIKLFEKNVHYQGIIGHLEAVNFLYSLIKRQIFSCLSKI